MFVNDFLSSRTQRNLDSVVQRINLTTGEDVSETAAGGTVSYQIDFSGGVFTHRLVIEPKDTFGCGTTYEVIIGGKGKSALKSVDRATLSGVPTGVTLEGSTASWTFRTLPC